MKIEIYPEECCEVCNEIIHNHMDCPACKKYAGTDMYGEVWYMNTGEILSCEDCGAAFVLKSKADGYLANFEWEQQNEPKKEN